MNQLVPMEGPHFESPSVDSFRFPGLFGTTWIDKPMLLLVIATILVIGFWVIASRKLKVLPGKGQFFVESIYDFIRNGVARDMLGPEYRRWTPLLVGLFTWVLVNNWFGEFFVFMFPTFSKIGFVWGVAALVMLIYIGAGISKHGLGYFKMALVPQGVPWYLGLVIAPIEFISNFITRPLTLAVRLFANMFAGHLSVMLFVIGGAFLLQHGDKLYVRVGGVGSLILSFAIMGLELFIGFLQAYIFTILTAQYISSSLADAH